MKNRIGKKLTLATVATVLCVAVSVSGQAAGDPYIWQPYNPNISFDFRTSNPNFQMPTRDTFPRNCQIEGTRSSQWFTLAWGPKVHGSLTTNNNRMIRNEIADPLLARLNEDFSYFRDVMGWPVCNRVRQGYRSVVYLYGSGAVCSDSQRDSTAQGGWQSSDGFSPMVLLSWRPILAFHGPSYRAAGFNDASFQTGAVVHEFIHVLLASMPDARRIPGWFHEGGNTWLQQQADAQRSGVFGNWATLNGPAFMAPFMPIECYSGWLQDGSFGGPNAEGVNRNNSSGQQLCTWRTWLGGTQYGNGFPSFLGEWLGLGSIPWIWQNANGRILEGMAKGLGEEQVRRLIYEYRAKQATLDMGRWTESARRIMNTNFNRNLGPEGNTAGGNWLPNTPSWSATPYARTTRANNILTPDPLTLPGWSGANQIPLTIPANMNTVTVDFMPDSNNMVLQLAYRDRAGRAVYSAPITNVRAGQTGTATLRLDTRTNSRPVNNVVIAVITNTNYIYTGDAIRHAKYSYRLRVAPDVTAASVNTQHFNITNPAMVIDTAYSSNPTAIVSDVNRIAAPPSHTTFDVSADRGSGRIRINYALHSQMPVHFDIYNTAGARIRSISVGVRMPGEYNTGFDMKQLNVPAGMYIIRLRNAPRQQVGIQTVMFVR